MTLHICAPQAIVFRYYKTCPACKLQVRMVAEDYTWWGTEWTCLNCGARFGEGLRRQTYTQRRRSIERGKLLWGSAPPRREAQRMWREKIGQNP